MRTHTDPFAPVHVPATGKQIAFLKNLLVERGLSLSNEELSALNKNDASKKISELLNTPKVTVPNKTSQIVTEAGMYRNPATGEIFKVQKAVHGSGHLYAKRLVVVDHEHNPATADVYFEYASGAVHQLRPEWRMSLEEAKAFGALYGTCCVCSRVLTDEKSIAAGIGPICARKV